VAMILMATHVTGYMRNGWHPQPIGNRSEHATTGVYETKDGLLMLAATNLRQQKRFWAALGRPDMAKATNAERRKDHANESRVIAGMMTARTADEWEGFFQSRHVPAGRVRGLRDTLADPQIAARPVLHRFEGAPGIEGPFSVPLAAFRLA